MSGAEGLCSLQLSQGKRTPKPPPSHFFLQTPSHPVMPRSLNLGFVTREPRETLHLQKPPPAKANLGPKLSPQTCKSPTDPQPPKSKRSSTRSVQTSQWAQEANRSPRDGWESPPRPAGGGRCAIEPAPVVGLPGSWLGVGFRVGVGPG